MKTSLATAVFRTIRGNHPAATLAGALAAVAMLCAGPTQAGTLTFAEPRIFPNPANHECTFYVVVADFNGDGKPDIATANLGVVYACQIGSVSVFLGNGDGTVHSQAAYVVGIDPWALATGDLNEDGFADILAVNRFTTCPGPYYISVLLNKGDGTGTFWPAQSIPAGYQNMEAAVVDLSGDGHLDIVVTIHGTGGSDGFVEVLLGAGNGSFNEVLPRMAIPGVAGVQGVAVADVNLDGPLDIVTANWWSYNVSVLRGLGDGRFDELPARPGIGQRAWSLAIGDLNRDGRPDLVVPNSYDYTVSLLFGNGDGTFQAQQVMNVGCGIYHSLVVDIDADGLLDIVACGFGGCFKVLFFRGRGDGSFENPVAYSAGASQLPYTIAVADLNSDGALDVVTANYTAKAVSVLLQIPPNRPPTCDAGLNLQIASADQASFVIQGTASDPDNDSLQSRWLEGASLLLDWTTVGASGEAPLALGSLPCFSIGNHTLTLEVTDTQITLSDEMVLTIQNSPPEARPAPSHQVVEIGVDPIVVIADVADFDGDTLSYQWLKDSTVLGSGTAETPQGGQRVAIPDLNLLPGDARFGVGVHQVELKVSDGVNAPVGAFVSVEVTDTINPSLSPIPSVTILWPPNHQLQPVSMQANAYDNGGGAIHLTAQVTSSEPPDSTGDGQTISDYYVDSVNDQTGLIELRLRSERSGKGPGRTYTVVITVTDASGNQSMARVEISAPHDKRAR